MRRAALLVILIGLLLAPAAGAAQSATPPDSPDTRIHITVQDDGDARWSVVLRMPLDTEHDVDAFETLQSDFVDGDAGETLSVDPFREAADRVAERTNESMEIVDVERTGDVQQVNETPVGTLTLSFTWTNFADVDEEEIRVGTAFESGWFGDLGPNQTLLIEPPEDYTVHTVEPGAPITNGTLVWQGPQEFAPGEPDVTFQPASEGPAPMDGPLLFSREVIAGVLVIGVVLVSGLVLVGWRRGWIHPPSIGDSDDEGTDEPPSPEMPSDEPEESPEETEKPGDGIEPSPGAATAEGGQSETEDEALLSDEERVERLLQEHGGRMKQARIVEETRWSNAKVSQLLSAMAEEGRVEKLRLGRENLISLPDEES